LLCLHPGGFQARPLDPFRFRPFCRRPFCGLAGQLSHLRRLFLCQHPGGFRPFPLGPFRRRLRFGLAGRLGRRRRLFLCDFSSKRRMSSISRYNVRKSFLFDWCSTGLFAILNIGIDRRWVSSVPFSSHSESLEEL
jgi:hypothetical protein